MLEMDLLKIKYLHIITDNGTTEPVVAFNYKNTQPINYNNNQSNAK